MALTNLKTYKYPAILRGENTKFQGVILYVHGFTDYVGRFAHLGKFFAEKGYDFYGMDQRGHGKSEG